MTNKIIKRTLIDLIRVKNYPAIVADAGDAARFAYD